MISDRRDPAGRRSAAAPGRSFHQCGRGLAGVAGRHSDAADAGKYMGIICALVARGLVSICPCDRNCSHPRQNLRLLASPGRLVVAGATGSCPQNSLGRIVVMGTTMSYPLVPPGTFPRHRPAAPSPGGQSTASGASSTSGRYPIVAGAGCCPPANTLRDGGSGLRR
jgi:hypothetical protein